MKKSLPFIIIAAVLVAGIAAFLVLSKSRCVEGSRRPAPDFHAVCSRTRNERRPLRPRPGQRAGRAKNYRRHAEGLKPWRHRHPNRFYRGPHVALRSDYSGWITAGD